MRTVIVHLHLFKNAGTTVERALHAHFGDRWAGYDKASPAGRVRQDELTEFLETRPMVEAVSSHQLRPPLLDDSGFAWLPLLFLRHPIDRIRSAYDFERRQGAGSPSSRAATTLDFAEWLQFHRHRPSSTQCQNFQVHALTSLRNASGAWLRRRPIEAHLESAQRFVEALPRFGLVESFPESWEWISQWIRVHHPGFCPPTGRDNATTSEAEGLQDRLDRLRVELGARHYAQLVSDNEADLALHAWAGERLQALRQAPGHPQHRT